MQLKRMIIIVIITLCILLTSSWLVSAFSLSSEGVYSSSGVSSSTSSDFGYSSDTLVMTGGAPSKPASSGTPTGGIPKGETIPPQWKPGTRSGIYLDPITQTNWVFDNVLQKFYSPDRNWFLITQFTSGGKVYAQFYYDPKSGAFHDMKSGNVVSGTSQGTAPAGQNNGLPSGTQPGSPSGNTPIVASEPPSQETPPGDSGTHPCRIICTSCETGYCDDCNQNGKCDEQENTVATESHDQSPAGITEDPQGPAQISGNLPGSDEQQTEEDNTEEPQVQGQNTPTGTTPGGFSEDAQSTILYQRALPTSGIYKIITCELSANCDYCLDVDGDDVCTESDYGFVLCGSEWGLTDLSQKDGKCLDFVILTLECSSPSECEFAEFCYDMDRDGLCDEENPESKI